MTSICSTNVSALSLKNELKCIVQEINDNGHN